MFSTEIFAKRLLLLRTVHNLSNSDLSDLLGLKSRTSISNLEAERILPSASLLNDIADLFGISADWLLGRSNEPYSNDILFQLEEAYIQQLWKDNFELFEKYGTYRLPYLFIIQAPNYQYPDTRINNFSLPLRANILFIFRWFQYIEPRTDNISSPFATIKEGFTAFSNALLKTISYTPKKQHKLHDTGHYYINLLEEILLTKKTTHPIFDISSPPSTEK